MRNFGSAIGVATLGQGVGWSSNPEIIGFGDSRTSINRQITSNASVYAVADQVAGYMDWAVGLSGNRVFFPTDGNFGKDGVRLSDMLSGINNPAWSPNTPGVFTPLTHPAGICVVFEDINSEENGDSLAKMQSDLTAILTALTGVRKRVLLITGLPTGIDDTGSVNQKPGNPQRMKDFHDWMNALSMPGVTPVDCWQDFINAASGTNFYNTQGLLYDGRHPNSRGAYLIGARLAAAINTLRSSFDYAYLPTSDADTYNVSTNPFGAINTHPLLPRTLNAGSKTASGGITLSGNICTGLSFTNSAALGAGVTVTLSQEVGPDGFDQQTMTWSGTASGAGILKIGFSGVTSSFVYGQKYIGRCVLGMDLASFAGVNQVRYLLQCGSDGTLSEVDAQAFNEDGSLFKYSSLIGNQRFPLVTPVLDSSKNQGNFSFVDCSVVVSLAAGAVGGTIHISRPKISKVSGLRYNQVTA